MAAEKRVTEVIETAKQEIDDARKAAARLSF
jgi:vacuolar-type H+-ATPase subunit H